VSERLDEDVTGREGIYQRFIKVNTHIKHIEDTCVIWYSTGSARYLTWRHKRRRIYSIFS